MKEINYMMTTEQIENTKHIFRQALYLYYLTNVAINHSEHLFQLNSDHISKFFAENCKKFSTHMAVINTLYNFLVIPREIIFNEFNKNPAMKPILRDIKHKLKNISTIIYPENQNSNEDLLQRLRNSLAHARFELKEGGFIFKDQRKNGKNKIIFFIKAEDLEPIINDIEYKIILPFVQGEIII